MKNKKQNPFKLREFRGVNSEHTSKLEAHGLKNANQMLVAGRTKELREIMARESGVPESVILELVKLSDLARLPGVKGIRARLYYEAGIDSIEKMASWEPDALREMMTKFVEQTGFLLCQRK